MRAPALTPRGLTLIEIIVVMGILAMIATFGVATYLSMARTSKEEEAAARIDVLLRQVRNSAVSSNSYAYVEIDTENRRITPWATKTIAMWHFEDTDDHGHTSGARHSATLRGAQSTRDGKIGKGVRLSPGNFVDGGADPDFDLDDGGYIEAYIKPKGDFSGDNYILSKEGAYALRVGGKGVLVGEISGNGKTKGVTVYSKTYRVAPGRWTKVALSWDRNVTRVLADDLVLATGPGATPPTNSNIFCVGHESQSFEGVVDEVRVLSAVAGGVLELAPSFTLTHTATPWNAVYFAGDGSLDMRFHAGPVQIAVEQDRRVRAVTVDMFGNTKRLELEKKEKPEEVVDPAETKRRQEDARKRVKLIGVDEKKAKDK